MSEAMPRISECDRQLVTTLRLDGDLRSGYWYWKGRIDGDESMVSLCDFEGNKIRSNSSADTTYNLPVRYF